LQPVHQGCRNLPEKNKEGSFRSSGTKETGWRDIKEKKGLGEAPWGRASGLVVKYHTIEVFAEKGCSIEQRKKQYKDVHVLLNRGVRPRNQGELETEPWLPDTKQKWARPVVEAKGTVRTNLAREGVPQQGSKPNGEV